MSVVEDFARCARLRMVELDWFRAAGVSGAQLVGYRVDPVAIGYAQFRLLYPKREPVDLGFEVRRARVQFLARNRFIPGWDPRADAAETVPALVIPAFEDGALVDLVAWHPKTGRIASLDRRAGWLAGPAPEPDAPLVVFADPLPWLAACRAGVVVVHESLARPFLLAQPAIQAADVDHGEKLQAMLAKVRLPRIVVPAFPHETARKAA
ncbi:hypothetical protein [Methylobacterium brachiatum]|uniref:hypothetical protein n=1 Tax=Methylobacterium brachiatum TaxID=269660 RepID=UPI000EFBF8CD|nr:hypothetical protein [Methylobacterium brachiatum]AYO85349.1 hypothetical protein EBB05_26075 [Methylobacterium brachiatum]